MRLDKYISSATSYTRSQSKKLIASKRVKVDEQITTDPSLKISQDAQVWIDDNKIELSGYRYILLHKPKGYICSTVDESLPSALNLIDLPDKSNLHFAGRLDQDTTGLVIISDDGQWTHQVTSPKKLCAKTYRVSLKVPITQNAIEELRKGILLNSESKETLPAEVKTINPQEILLTIYEGKYHQVKRMLAAVNNRVISLHREQVGELTLAGLEEGSWRQLTNQEVKLFET